MATGTVYQKQVAAREMRGTGLWQTISNGNMTKTFQYAGVAKTISLKFGMPRIPGEIDGSRLIGIAFNYIVRSGGLTSVVCTLARYIDTNGATESMTNIPLNAPTPAYNLVVGTTVNRPVCYLTSPTDDTESTTTTINYLFSVIVTASSANTIIEVTGADILYTPAGTGISTGTLQTGQYPANSSYLKSEGQVLSQSEYPDLFAKVGITPSFNCETRGVIMGNMIDIEYGPSIATYIGICSNDSRVYVSRDAITWNGIGIGITGAPTSIAWCSKHEHFVLANGTTNLYSSFDGYNWSIIYVYASVPLVWIAGNDSMFVAAGSNSTDGNNEYVWSSTNMTDWSRFALGVTNKTITALYWSEGFGSGQYIIGCSDGTILTSAGTDLTVWTVRTSNISAQINAFVLGGTSAPGMISACGNNGAFCSSTDNGVTWANRSIAGVGNVTGIAYSSRLDNWFAVGPSQYYTSVDGRQWILAGNDDAGLNHSIFKHKGIFTLIGQNGLISNSPDLVTWTAISSGVTVTLNAGATNGSIAVIVGASGTIISSTDSISWSVRTSNAGANSLNHVIWCEGVSRFIAAGASGALVTSPDGITWTARTSNIAATINCVAAFGSTLVAVSAAGTIASSSNGTTWTARTSNTSKNIRCVVYTRGFCAICDFGIVLISADGITWENKQMIGPPANSTYPIWAMTDGNVIYATMSGGTNYRSEDAITWTSYGIQESGGCIFNDDPALVIATPSIWYSNTGTTWTRGTTCKDVLSSAHVHWFDEISKYVITSSSATSLSYSSDGTTWVGLMSVIPSAIACDKERIIIGLNNGGMLLSVDAGVTWSMITSLVGSGNITDMCGETGKLIAVTSTYVIATSSDGNEWQQCEFSDKRIGYIAGGFSSVIRTERGIYVAVGRAGLIVTSTDATTWTIVDSGVTVNLTQVCYNVELGMFAVSGEQGVILTSTDGNTWTKTLTYLGEFKSIASLESKGFVAGGYPISAYSPDGVTWNYKTYNGIINTGKAIYGPVDHGAFQLMANSSVNDRTVSLHFTNDGKTCREITLATPSDITWKAIMYCDVVDKYFIIGSSNGVWFGTLTRTYDRNSQFVLPVLNDQIVKLL